jgi:hypothetical protein
MSDRASTVLFIVGIIFLVLGLFLYLTWWFFLHGMIALVIGAVLVLITKKSWLVKGLLAGIPVLFVAWSFSRTFAPAQTFLLPNDLSGTFTVVHGEACGAPDEVEDGRFLIRVPSSGFAILQRELPSGWIDDKFFFENERGERTNIPVYFNLAEAMKFPAIVGGVTGNVPGPLPDGSFSSDAPGTIHYHQYHLVSDTTEKWPADPDVEPVVQECRDKLAE